MHGCDAACIRGIAQSFMAISNRLRPARYRRVLGTDAAASRQRSRPPALPRHVEHHANIAPATERTLSHQGSGGGIFQICPNRQHERP